MRHAPLSLTIRCLSMLALATVLGCDDGESATSLECGAGTIEQGEQCVGDPSMACGPGTMLMGTQCLPTDTMPDVECGDGTTDVDGVCVPDVACGPGTVADMMGQCVPSDAITCGAGTTETDGECIADVVCGGGTILDGGECVPEPDTLIACGPNTVLVGQECVTTETALELGQKVDSVEPDDPALGGTPTSFMLAANGDSMVLAGTIETDDFDDDMIPDQDTDVFAFDATAGQVLQIRIVPDGLPAPFAMVQGGDASTESFMRRTARAEVEPARQIVIPGDGSYELVVGSDFAAESSEPLGSPDFGYFVIVETLGELTPTAGMLGTATNAPVDDPRSGARNIEDMDALGTLVVGGSAPDGWLGSALLLTDATFYDLPVDTGMLVPTSSVTVVPDWMSGLGPVDDATQVTVTVDIPTELDMLVPGTTDDATAAIAVNPNAPPTGFAVADIGSASEDGVLAAFVSTPPTSATLTLRQRAVLDPTPLDEATAAAAGEAVVLIETVSSGATPGERFYEVDSDTAGMVDLSLAFRALASPDATDAFNTPTDLDQAGDGSDATATTTTTIPNGCGSVLFARLEVDLAHDAAAELALTLEAPDGETIAIADAGDLMDAQLPALDFPLTDTPTEDFGTLAGVNADGTWTLTVEDTAVGSGMAGTLNSWTLSLFCMP